MSRCYVDGLDCCWFGLYSIDSMWENIGRGFSWEWTLVRWDSTEMIPAEDIPCLRVRLNTHDREEKRRCTLGTGLIWLGYWVGWLMLRLVNTHTVAKVVKPFCVIGDRDSHHISPFWPSSNAVPHIPHSWLSSLTPTCWLMTPVAYIASVVVLVHPITLTGSMYPDVMVCLGFLVMASF